MVLNEPLEPRRLLTTLPSGFAETQVVTDLHSPVSMDVAPDGRVFLTEQAGKLHRRLRSYRRLQLRVRDRVGTSYGEHEDVVQAILDGDGERTAELLRKHILVQGQRFADLIASLPKLEH